MLKLYRKSLLPTDSDKRSVQNGTRRNVGYNTVLLVYQTLPGNMRRLVTSKVISLARSDWIKIDVTEIAQSWVDEPGMNHGIEVECTSQNISQIIGKSSDNGHRPTLDILTYEKSINVKRKRRQASLDTTCEAGKNTCCRQPVQIEYSDVGLHPEFDLVENESATSFTAYLCSKRCPRNHLLHNHWSRIKNMLRSKYADLPHYKTRCAPVAFESFQYFHVADGDPGITILDDVVVKECACV